MTSSKKTNLKRFIALALTALGLALLFLALKALNSNGILSLGWATPLLASLLLLTLAIGFIKPLQGPLLELRLNTLVLLGAVLFCLQATNMGLGLIKGWGNDNRIKADVLRQRLPQEPNLQIVVAPRNFINEPKALLQGALFPLSGVPDADTLLCNEGGPWVSYRADRYGFRNPDEVWDKAKLDVAIIGDSFVHGVCAKDESSFVDQVRAQFPATLGLGILGNGPLIELATLKEFGLPKQPTHTIWVFYEGNDLFRQLDDKAGDLDFEWGKAGKLQAYLQPSGYRQYFDRQRARFKTAVEQLAVNNRTRHLNSHPNVPVLTPLWYFGLDQWQLAHVQSLLNPIYFMLGFNHLHTPSPASAQQTLNRFDQVLASAEAGLKQHHSHAVMVYLPEKTRFALNTPNPMHDYALQLAEAHGFDTIDLVPRFTETGNPLGLYTRQGHHLSQAGNDLVARTLITYLQQQTAHPQ
ncbi:MAG: hypothetical protein KC475_09055 [Cyanobacteria bacterium HKST-UBA03]|nr:hypothetical protein [Cyanobacteria bacterium HKST-UBA03]